MVMSKAIKATGAAMASIALTLSMAPMAAYAATEAEVMAAKQPSADFYICYEQAPKMVDITIPTSTEIILYDDGTAQLPTSLPITNNDDSTPVTLYWISVDEQNQQNSQHNTVIDGTAYAQTWGACVSLASAPYVDDEGNAVDNSASRWVTHGRGGLKPTEDLIIEPNTTSHVYMTAKAKDTATFIGHPMDTYRLTYCFGW